MGNTKVSNFTPADDSRFYHAAFKGLFDMHAYGMGCAMIMEMSGYRNNTIVLYLAIGSYIGGFIYSWTHHET